MEKFMKNKCLLALLACLLLISCGKRNYFPKEIEQKQIEIVRFDQQLLAVNESNAQEQVRELYKSDFMPYFMEDILGIRTYDTAYMIEALPKFLEDTIYQFKQTNQLAKAEYENIDTIQQELNSAFSKISYLYPEFVLPKIYFFLSGFNASIYFFEDNIAVGVDMYLGSDYPLYSQVVYEYQKKTMKKECVSLDIVSAYLFKNIPYTSTEHRLIEQMLYRGKIMYLLQLLFPEKSEAEIMGYTEEQVKWCREYERPIWNKVIEKGDLFKNDHLLINSYLNDGPFTAEISQESPGRLGTWMGMKVIESYFYYNRKATIQEVMAEGDAKQIIKKSKYDP